MSTESKVTKPLGTGLKIALVQPPNNTANIASVVINFPTQLPVRLTTLQQACPAATFQANPAKCSSASDVGTATVQTPILGVPLRGPVYLVSHGGAKFPSVVLVLQGEGVTLYVEGQSAVSRAGVLKATFNAVPDAPFTRFETTLPSGKFSEFTTSKTIKGTKTTQCGEALAAPVTIVGQNGKRVTQSVKLAVTGCSKARKKAPSNKTKHKKTTHK
jgi:hypothetical protein